MKRFMIFTVFVLALAFITINLPGVNPAQSQTLGTKVDIYQEKKLVKSVVFAIGVNKYFVDGKTDGVAMDAKPFLQDGRTFVPIRFLSNALGVEDKNILWDDPTQKVTLISKIKVEMKIGEKFISSNGNKTDIDVTPILKVEEGRTYLPARYVAEALGYDVGWDESSQTVLCWPKGEAKPDVSAVVKKVEDERAKTEKPVEQMTRVERAIKSATEMGYILPSSLKEVKGYSPSLYRFELPTKMWVDVRVETGDPEDRHKGVNIGLWIWLPSSEYAKNRLSPDQWRTKEDFEAQLQQAEEILASKHGRDIARTVIDYAKKKTDNQQELIRKEFPLPQGGEIAVASQFNTPYTLIDVWR